MLRTGAIVKYIGASQAGILAPGDEVELGNYDYNTGLWTFTIPYSFCAVTFTGKDSDFEVLDKKLPSGYPKPEVVELSFIDKSRKENGECLKCGTKRRMSMFGLLPCSTCESSQPPRW